MPRRLWLLLAAQFAALHGGLVLHQVSGSLVYQTGRTVTLTCEVKGSSSNTPIHWLRQHHAQSEKRHYEFLVTWDPKKKTVYGEKAEKERLSVSGGGKSPTLNITKAKPADSGTYFCMTIGNPELTFGKEIQLTVVDILPTTARPTQKSTTKKKPCKFPNSRRQKDLSCGFVTLGLLLAGVLVLLVSLGVAIHQHCQRRKARLRFIKQFYK
ncbi:PREDICTED: T-cell surface glycoprotein CD8 beta chain [Condylura cristata]|uniref:T-cell surface glycoprotein CD8 beta chain n=1 Tax=Condylura cristata TaxID=143302 RepID=UPI000643D655|nr:PREDICTED: T-cell surface glycoprotein CD8 beta chain [Condylura cristata]